MKAFFDQVEAFLVEVASRVAPWLASLPTAWSVGFSAFTVLGFPWLVSAAVGVAVEAVGVSSVNLALTLHSYNRVRGKDDPIAPFGLAVVLVLVYFFVAVLLAVVVDVLPGVAKVAPAVFPFLSLVGAGNLGLRYDHVQRVAATAARQAQRAAQEEKERQEKRDYRRSMREMRQNAQGDASGDASHAHDASHDATHKKLYTCGECGIELPMAKAAAHARWAHREGNGNGNGNHHKGDTTTVPESVAG